MSRVDIDTELETLRQLVIHARSSTDVEGAAEESLHCLRLLYERYGEQFTAEDVRWINVLKRFLRERLQAHKHPKPFTKLQRKPPSGRRRDHCFRCKTTVDERHHEVCGICSSPSFHWVICPMCGACGCDYSPSA